MHVKITPRGRDAFVRIPKSAMQTTGLKLHDMVEISATTNQIILHLSQPRRAKPRKKPACWPW